MNKKGSKGSKTEVSSYEIGDTVLGKVRGYPPWPGRVADPDIIPSDVVKERPPIKKGVVYCIQFFPAGDFSWLSPKDISKLKPNEIETYIVDHPEVKRSGDLLQGYKIARDPRAWAQEIAEKLTAKAAEEEDDEEAEGDADEEDELADDGERPASSKKRKSSAGNTFASAATKKRKRNSEPGAKAKSTPKTKGPGKGHKSKAAIESEDEEDAQEPQALNKNAPTASPPPAKKAKTSAPSGKEENPDDAELAKDPEATKVREWRHKLQKVFLSSKVQAPKQEDMPEMNELFTQVETYDKINIAYLSFSKIGKVMRHITALPDDRVPLDSQYKFRDRAKVLVERWQHIINASRVDGKELSSKPSAKDSGFGSKAPAANGIGSKSSPGETSQSPGGANENVNGIADAINSSIATGTVETDDGPSSKVNGNGHFNGDPNSLAPATSTASLDTEAVGDASLLPDITMSEMGGE